MDGRAGSGAAQISVLVQKEGNRGGRLGGVIRRIETEWRGARWKERG